MRDGVWTGVESDATTTSIYLCLDCRGGGRPRRMFEYQSHGAVFWVCLRDHRRRQRLATRAKTS